MGLGPIDVAWFQRLTTSGVVGDSGKPVDIVGYTISSGASLGTASFQNGALQTSPTAWQEQATTASQEISEFLGFPIRLDKGCYVSFGTNVTAVSVFYRQVLT